MLVEIIYWENTAAFHKLPDTTQYFDKIWTDRIVFSAREEGAHPFERAALVVNGRRLTTVQLRDAILLVNQLGVENEHLKKDLNATTVATTITTAGHPTSTPPLLPTSLLPPPPRIMTTPWSSLSKSKMQSNWR